MNYSDRLQKVIPAGCHTYSRGDDQFPRNAPQILSRATGAYVYDPSGKRFLDYGMGLRSVTCGYGESSIVKAAHEAMEAGNCLTRPSMIELEAAEMLTGLLGTDMVKFTKTGSAATTAAFKLARAATGRTGILFPKRQPFFSYDDWFIETTSRNHAARVMQGAAFEPLDLEGMITNWKPAAILTEPYGDLGKLRHICDKNGIILIFDEMITGFRYRLGSKTDIKPDLACYGKALANGFSVAALTGKREIMELGARNDMFLLSTTHGAEMCALAAMMASIRFMEKCNVIQHLHDYGAYFCSMMRQAGLTVAGDDVNPALRFDNAHAKTLFMQEICKQGILMPWIAFSHAHGELELDLTREAVTKALDAIAKGAALEGPVIKPVFQ